MLALLDDWRRLGRLIFSLEWHGHVVSLKQRFHVFDVRLHRQVLRLHVQNLPDNHKNVVQGHSLFGPEILKQVLNLLFLHAVEGGDGRLVTKSGMDTV